MVVHHLQVFVATRAPDGTPGLFALVATGVSEVRLHEHAGSVCVVTLTARRGRQKMKRVEKVVLQKLHTEICSDLGNKAQYSNCVFALLGLVGQKGPHPVLQVDSLPRWQQGQTVEQCGDGLKLLLRLSAAGWECRLRSCGTLLMRCLLTCRAKLNGCFSSFLPHDIKSCGGC